MHAETGLLAVLASPRRCEILRLVWDQERAAGDIHREMPDVTFGAVSLQLRRLESAGLVARRREGRFQYYRARRAALGEAAGWLEQMWGNALWRLKLQAELDAARRGPPARRRAIRSDQE